MTTTRHDQQRLRVGVASLDITPPVGSRMQGYKVRCAEAITDPLLVSALAVGSHATEWLLLSVVRIDRVTDSLHSSPLALIVHYACHATSSGGVPRISADWPGTMRSVLQSIYGKNTAPVVCFLQGCAGDVTHRIARDRGSWP